MSIESTGAKRYLKNCFDNSPIQTDHLSRMKKETAMRVKEILNNYELCLADIEVMLNGETLSAPTLCVTDGHEVIPLNTPDGRPIQMNKANAIQLGDGKWV